jgi:uridine kinase
VRPLQRSRQRGAGCRQVHTSGVQTDQLEYVIAAIISARAKAPPARALLVAISGIDAAGKGFVTSRIAESLEKRGIKPAVITADGWLNLPHVRFGPRDPAANFYEHAIRFDQMFEQLVLPLRDHRSINLEADLTEETATTFRKHRYDFRGIDVILLEGIFLLKPAYRFYYDLSLWIDCSFATALQRAITRCQEKLPPRETITAFQTIYFPAQRIHLASDDPLASADVIFRND